MNNHDIIEALRKFVNQRSGIDWRDYFHDFRDIEGRKAFASEKYEIAKDGKHARALLTLCDSLEIPLSQVLNSEQRLSINSATGQLEYTTGQYFPTEYRAVVCRVCASAIWRWLCDTERARNRADVQAWIKPRLGRGIVQTWFS